MIEPSSWPTYNEAHEKGEPFILLARAIEKAPDKEAALDLGAGPLKETKALLKAGFRHVVVVDSEADVARRAGQLGDERVEMHQSSFQDYDFPRGAFSLVNAVKSLPFIPPGEFDSVFEKVKASLKPGGIFVGNLFGTGHAFAGNTGMKFFPDIASVRALFHGMDADVEEVRVDNPEKTHRHVFNFIARKI